MVYNNKYTIFLYMLKLVEYVRAPARCLRIRASKRSIFKLNKIIQNYSPSSNKYVYKYSQSILMSNRTLNSILYQIYLKTI